MALRQVGKSVHASVAPLAGYWEELKVGKLGNRSVVSKDCRMVDQKAQTMATKKELFQEMTMAAN